MDPPVACSLTVGDLTARRARWGRLAGRALRAHEPTAEGVRLRFAAVSGVDAELEDLVAAERECCAFARWSVTRAPGELVLTVSATGEGIPVVRELLAPLG